MHSYSVPCFTCKLCVPFCLYYGRRWFICTICLAFWSPRKRPAVLLGDSCLSSYRTSHCSLSVCMSGQEAMTVIPWVRCGGNTQTGPCQPFPQSQGWRRLAPFPGLKGGVQPSDPADLVFQAAEFVVIVVWQQQEAGTPSVGDYHISLLSFFLPAPRSSQQ